MNLKPQLFLILLGILFHLIYIFSIFDIYFTSPLVKGQESYKIELPPLAKRLVLIVGDGLRADTFYKDNPKVLAPFLHSIIREKGSGGISNTRVPTESRPGHVAIIAGFYEDVSAVTKGWSLNPVSFDSVFNQSNKVFSYGSPDILPMFKEGAKYPENVICNMYHEDDEDFSKDPRKLDEWVFNELSQHLNETSKEKDFKKEKNVIFLHMLGLDTAGHGYRPNNQKYKDSMIYLDQKIKEIYHLIENYYGDNETAYLFTSDHGMGNLGSHGDGHPDNTRTPIVAWGKGIKKSQINENEIEEKEFKSWKISSYFKKSLNQADIAPLMSSLLGINFPMNSVGKLPLDYLDANDSFLAEAKLVNVKQILHQYIVKEELKQQNELFYEKYHFKNHQEPSEIVNNIQSLIQQKKYNKAIIESDLFIDELLQALRYLQTYDWLFLRTIITLGYLGWIIFTLIFILENQNNNNNNNEKYNKKSNINYENIIHLISIVTLIIMYIILYKKQSPLFYFGYILFPIYFWNQTIINRNSLIIAIKNTKISKLIQVVIITLICLELMVFSYFKRSILSFGFLLLSILPWLKISQIQVQNRLLIIWSIVCLMNATFPTFSVEKVEDINLVVFGGFIIILIGLTGIYFAEELIPSAVISFESDNKRKQSDESTKNEIFEVRKRLLIQILFIIISIIQMYLSSNQLKLRHRNENLVLAKFEDVGDIVPPYLHYLGWLILSISIIYLILINNIKQHYLLKLISIFLAFAPSYIILSISYEILFYSTLFGLLFTWIIMEQINFKNKQLVIVNNNNNMNNNNNNNNNNMNINQLFQKLSLNELKQSLLFLFLINVSFFSCGNMASISSFSLEAVYRLTVKFNPFLMGTLLIFKILIPFFLLSSSITIINQLLNLEPFSIFLLSLSLTDIMTLNFFFLVKDEGSWLEIGTSISHFIIASSFVLFITLLYFLAYLLTKWTMLPKYKSLKMK